jgi:hypothetical protein
MGRVILAVKLNRWVAIRLVYRNAIIGSGDTYYSSAHDSPQYVLGSENIPIFIYQCKSNCDRELTLVLFPGRRDNQPQKYELDHALPVGCRLPYTR